MESKDKYSQIQSILKSYAYSDSKVATWQVINTVIPYFIIWSLAVYLALQNTSASLAAALGVASLNGLLLTRLFVLQHDCGHHSFYPTKRLNNIVGNLLSVITFTPPLQLAPRTQPPSFPYREPRPCRTWRLLASHQSRIRTTQFLQKTCLQSLP